MNNYLCMLAPLFLLGCHKKKASPVSPICTDTVACVECSPIIDYGTGELGFTVHESIVLVYSDSTYDTVPGRPYRLGSQEPEEYTPKQSRNVHDSSNTARPAP